MDGGDFPWLRETSRYDVLCRVPKGQQARRETLADQVWSAADLAAAMEENRDTYSGRNYEITVQNSQGQPLRQVWYDQGHPRLRDVWYQYQDGALRRKIRFNGEGVLQEAHAFHESLQVTELHTFRDGRLDFLCVYEYNANGQMSRCLSFQAGGTMAWYALAAYDGSGNEARIACFDAQGELLLERRQTGGGQEIRYRDQSEIGRAHV